VRHDDEFVLVYGPAEQRHAAALTCADGALTEHHPQAGRRPARYPVSLQCPRRQAVFSSPSRRGEPSALAPPRAMTLIAQMLLEATLVFGALAVLAVAVRSLWTRRFPTEVLERAQREIGLAMPTAAIAVLVSASLLGDELVRADALASGVVDFGVTDALLPALAAGTRLASAAEVLGLLLVSLSCASACRRAARSSAGAP